MNPKNMNTFLEPLVDELLDLWNGSYLQTSSVFGIKPVHGALICVSFDLPATCKACGFTSFIAWLQAVPLMLHALHMNA